MKDSAWFVVLSNGIYLLPASIALYLHVWERAFLFVCIVFISGFYHVEREWRYEDTNFSNALTTQQRLLYDADNVLSFYLIATCLTLLARFQRRIYELIGELAVLGYSIGIFVWNGEQLPWWLVVASVSPLLLPIGLINLTQHDYTPLHDLFPTSRIVWLSIGLLWLVGGVVFYILAMPDDNVTLHAIWHLCTGMAASCWLWTLRSPGFMPASYTL